MTIPLIKEAPDLQGRYECLEQCFFCGRVTKFWHENTNNPVCRTCAKNHVVLGLPDYGQRVRAAKRARKKKRVSMSKTEEQSYRNTMITLRILDGDRPADLSKEYGIAPVTIRSVVLRQIRKVKLYCMEFHIAYPKMWTTAQAIEHRLFIVDILIKENERK